MTLAQIGLAVRNLDEAVEFYRDKLGLNLRARSKNMALFDCGECRLALVRTAAEHPENSAVYFHVDDLEAWGGPGPRRGGAGGPAPPEGNRLGMMCGKRPPASPEASRLQ